MTDPLLLGADVLVLRDGEIRTPDGEALAVVETRGAGGARMLLRELYRWTSYRKRGLRHLAHRLAVLSPDGEPLFDVDKRHDRAFRRVLLWVYGPAGLPIGRVERVRNLPMAGVTGGLRLVGADGAMLGTLRRRLTVEVVGFDSAGCEVARVRYAHHGGGMVGEVSFTEASEPYRILTIGYAAMIYLVG